MSTIDKLISTLEATPQRQRGGVMHNEAVKTLASWSEARAAEVLAAFRELGHPAGAAFENLMWEARFERT